MNLDGKHVFIDHIIQMINHLKSVTTLLVIWINWNEDKFYNE